MSEPKEVKIAYNDIKALLDVLEYIDISNYAPDFQNAFESVLDPFKRKIESIERRQAYSNLIQANKTGSEEKKFDARIDYLKKSRH